MRAAIPDASAFPDAESLRKWYPLLLFNVFLFFTGFGSMFFRMARDNDDVVRTVLMLATAGAFTFVLGTGRLRLPAALVIPCLGYAASQFLSAAVSVNVAESMKEFLKIGFYMILVLTLSAAAAGNEKRERPLFRWTVPAVLVVIGFLLGWYHTVAARREFLLWTPQQLTASLLTSAVFCAAFVAFLARGSVRQAGMRGLVVLAVVSCALALLQFYHLDPLRPYDPRQPYHIFVRNLPPDVLTFIASITKGTLTMENGKLILLLPRILSIYGNPDFFAPYLLQFIPLAVAYAALNPAWRNWSVALSGGLLFTLFLTQVWGAFLALVVIAPFFVILLGFLRGSVSWEKAVRISAGWVMAGVAVFGLLMWILYSSGHKRVAIAERLVKYRMAAEMWMASPVIGTGLNTYKSWYPVIQQRVRLEHDLPFEALGSSATQENRTHNDIAQLLAETGVVGTAMFLWCVIALLYGGLRYLKRDSGATPVDRANVSGLMGGLAVIVVYSLPNFPFHIVSSAGTFWFMAGLLGSYLVRTPRNLTEGESAWPPARLKRPFLAAALVTVFLMIVHGTHLFLGTLLYRLANPNPAIYKMPPDPVKAAEYYENSLKYDPANGQYFYEYGVMCFNLLNEGREPQLAERTEGLLRRARRLGFMCDDLAWGLGHIAHRERRFDEAREWYDYATTLNERHDRARAGQMQMLLRELVDAEKALGAKKYRRARELYEEALKRDPRNHVAAYKLGFISVTAYHDTEAAIAHIGDAARIAVNHAPYYLALAEVLVKAERHEEARRALEKAAVLDPKSDTIRNNLDRITKFLQARKAGEKRP